MPDPSQTAGGSPDDWGGNGGGKKKGPACLLILVAIIGLTGAIGTALGLVAWTVFS